MEMEKLAIELCSKYNLDPNIQLKKKIRGLNGFNTKELLIAILSTDSIPKAALFLGYTENPVKEAIRAILKPIFIRDNYSNGGSHSGWQNTLLGVLGYRHCAKCNSIKLFKEFYGRKPTCNSCSTADSKLHKIYIKDRTPQWSDLDAINNFYTNCPKGYEVDHIIPLRGKVVSGLHVLNNLQYLTIEQNRNKNNSYSCS